jgi:hypothetical protein
VCGCVVAEADCEREEIGINSEEGRRDLLVD